MKRPLTLLLILMTFSGMTGFATSNTFQDYQNYNHGYCPSCNCAPCSCNAPVEDGSCAPEPCAGACDPCAPVCGAECGISICAIGVAVAAVAAAAAIIIASGDGSSTHAHGS